MASAPPDLREKIRAAQVRAGEDVVCQDLHDRGLCSKNDYCPVCQRLQDEILLSEKVTLSGPGSIVEVDRLAQTLAERGGRYGDFTNNARVAQQIRDVVRTGESWCRMSFVEREALDAIILKISRIVTGDPHYLDNWHDIAGFAKLAEDRSPATS